MNSGKIGKFLMLAACIKDTEIFKLFLEHATTADIEYQHISGDTCLIVASRSGNIEIVQLLMDKIKTHGFVDLTNTHGRSALSYASSHGYTEIVRILLDHGCVPDRRWCDTKIKKIFREYGFI